MTQTLRQFEQGIRLLMPSFQRALLALQPPNGGGELVREAATDAPQIQDAAKIRKRLTDSFAKYDLAARRIRDLKSTSPTQLRLQKAIYAQASNFLHINLVPLKSVPRMLKSQSSRSNHRRAALRRNWVRPSLPPAQRRICVPAGPGDSQHRRRERGEARPSQRSRQRRKRCARNSSCLRSSGSWCKRW